MSPHHLLNHVSEGMGELLSTGIPADTASVSTGAFFCQVFLPLRGHVASKNRGIRYLSDVWRDTGRWTNLVKLKEKGRLVKKNSGSPDCMVLPGRVVTSMLYPFLSSRPQLVMRSTISN